MDDLSDVKNFLAKVEAITIKHVGVANKEQYGFNIFSILRKSHEEVGLHSSFLKSLFDPQGGHGQGPWFLNRFLEKLDIEGFESSSDLGVYTEYTKLRVSEGKSERDSIDVYIKSDNRAVVIENKIYAGDQDEQIKRYIDIADKEGATRIDVIYLTLDGHPPNKTSLGNFKIHNPGEETNSNERQHEYIRVHLASYQEDVDEWLTQCTEHMVQFPTTRETLVLYQRLVRELTGKSLDQEEIMEIAEYLETKDNLSLMTKVLQGYRVAKTNVQLAFWKALDGALKKELDLSPYRILRKEDKSSQIYSKPKIEAFYSSSRNRPWYGIKILLGTITGTNMDICFMLEVEHNLYYGFLAQEQGKDWREREKIKKETLSGLPQICQRIDYKTSNWWLGWKYPRAGVPNFRDFNNLANELADENIRLEYVTKLSAEVIGAIKAFREEVETSQISVAWGSAS